MLNVEKVVNLLKEYNGKELKIMEVCGTHTSSIFKSGIRDLISPKIKLISGPGCPVCVTPTAYIDACIDYSMKDKHMLLTFGDMMKVPGTNGSLSDARGRGAKVEIMYSPLEVIDKAAKNPDITYIIAAVGFETTAPIYGLALEEAMAKGLKNIKIVTALKTVMPALEWICSNEEGIDGFLCPGHVSVVIGSDVYKGLSQKYKKPFVVAGFEAEHILAGIYSILYSEEKCRNLYSNAVKPEGNLKALNVIRKFYEPGTAMWRGLGMIEGSGLYLKKEFEEYNGGGFGLDKDMELPKSCRCGDVIVGRINPNECAMFGERCNPYEPFGPCMVSAEGACGIWYRNGGGK